MEYESLKLVSREATQDEVEEMEFYLRTGCVHEDYLRKVLGDQSIGISVLPKEKRLENCI